MATERSREGSGAERSDRGNDLWNKEADLGEQVQESATGPHDTTGMTLENFLEHSRPSLCSLMQRVCVHVYVQVGNTELVSLLVSVCVCVVVC